MPCVRDSFWRGRDFTTVVPMQAAAVLWSRDVAGQRACRPLDGAAPAAVFAAVAELVDFATQQPFGGPR